VKQQSVFAENEKFATRFLSGDVLSAEHKSPKTSIILLLPNWTDPLLAINQAAAVGHFMPGNK
jgi:hypothetical protein